MNLIKFQPASRSLTPFHSDFNRIFDQFFADFGLSGHRRACHVQPTVDIIEKEDQLQLLADMPGMEKKDIKVTVSDGLLTIEGSRDEVLEESEGSYRRTERVTGTFHRSFKLPEWVDSGNVDASYKNGVLSVTIPKLESARPREIEVNVN